MPYGAKKSTSDLLDEEQVLFLKAYLLKKIP